MAATTTTTIANRGTEAGSIGGRCGRLALGLLAALALAGCGQAPPGLTGISTASIVPGNASGSSVIPGTVGGSRSAGATAAVPAERVTGSLYRITTSDRRISDRIERENYTLLRAAETTRQVGGTHFVMVKAGEQSTDLPSLSTLAGGGQQFGAYIRVLEIDPEQGAPIGALSADEIIQFFGPKFTATAG